jgi:hypothetical protein
MTYEVPTEKKTKKKKVACCVTPCRLVRRYQSMAVSSYIVSCVITNDAVLREIQIENCCVGILRT